QQQDGEDFSHANSLFGVGVASLYVAPPLYDASDFASFSRAEKAILPVMTLIYTIQRRGWRENVHLNKKRKKVIVRGLQGHRILV
ncbi:hypothetical protein, partial [Klebsiella oxytoca]|uniref:hypothetical protein n=1 Tax=Klebsiella oxytoca TaxID=571 RepID=UPI00190E921C